MKQDSEALQQLLSRLKVSREAERKIEKLVRATATLRSASERCLAVVGPTLPLLEGAASNSVLSGIARLPLVGGAAAATQGSARTALRAVEIARYWESFDEKELRPLRGLAQASERLRRSQRVEDVPAFLSEVDRSQRALGPLRATLGVHSEKLASAARWVSEQADKRRSERLARAAGSLRSLGETLGRGEGSAKELEMFLSLCRSDALAVIESSERGRR